jgi:ElaB/YqjD/DUF883 family membrane-anchored ribosome-binding protein
METNAFMSHQEPRVPSGGEVESATIRREAAIHQPVIPVEVPFAGDRFGEPQSSWKSRLSGVVGKVKSALPRRAVAFPPGVGSTVSGRMKTAVSTARESLRANPARYAGIAGGIGLGLGIVGRMLRHRMRVHSLQPRVLVIREYC